MNPVSAEYTRCGKLYRLRFLLTGLIFLLLIAGCDNTFEPLQENDRFFFSIFGYLDVSADTQWVRVVPVRESIENIPDMEDVTVTLEHIGEGEKAVMKDSLFTYFHSGEAYNHWVAMELFPEETYRLSAAYPDGRSSYVEVIMPEDFPTPVLDNETMLEVDGVKRLADVRTVYHVLFPLIDQVERISFPKDEISPRPPDGYRINLRPGRDRSYLNEFFAGGEIIREQIFVASAGPEWHDFRSLERRIFNLPDEISNVENGVGFLTGVVSKTIPFETCLDEESGESIPCPLQPPPW